MARDNACFTQDIIEAAKTAETMAEIARMVGCARSNVTRVLQLHAPDAYREFSLKSTRMDGAGAAKRDRILKFAAGAASIAEVARIVGCAHRYAARTLRDLAPDEYERLTSLRADSGAGKPVCWTSRAHALFPDDEALARSLARAASFVAKTRDGVTVRLVPPRSEGQAA